MSRIQGHLVTIVGCMVSLASFCFLPYLVVPWTPFTFTGLQLVTLGPQIPLPGYAPIANIPAVLQNIPFIWVPPFFVALLLLAAVGDVLLTHRGEPASQGLTRGILIVASLTLFFSLCSCTRNAFAGFSPISAHGNTLSGFLWGSLFTPGFLGFLVGMIVALIGSMITLRSKR